MTTEKKYHQDGDDVREYTEAQYAQYATDKAAANALATQASAVLAARTAALAKLAALGLTTDDLKALGLGGNE